MTASVALVHLPSSILSLCFSCLCLSSYLSLSQCCRLLHSTSLLPTSSPHVIIVHHDLSRWVSSDELPASLLRLRPRSVVWQVPPDSLSAGRLAALGAMHRSLTLLDLHRVPDDCTTALLTSFTSLISLTVRNVVPGLVTTPLTSLTALRTVSIFRLPLLAVPLLPRSLTALGGINGAGGAPHASEKEAGWAALLSLPLTSLDLDSPLSTAALTTVCAGLPQLRALQCELQRGAVLPPLPSCLTSLRCRGWKTSPPMHWPAALCSLDLREFDYSAPSPAHLHAFASLGALTDLTLENCELTETGLAALCAVLPVPALLRSLSLCWNESLTSVQALSVFALLTSLNLSNCTSLGGQPARDVLPRLPALTSIDITDLGIPGMQAVQPDLFPLLRNVLPDERH